jgi:lysophospholipase L1-like esterase
MQLPRRFFSALTLAGVFALLGCDPGKQSPKPVQASNQGKLRFLALGDSYTIGESVAESQRWPVQLAEALRAEGIDVGNVDIVARTGWRTDDLDAGIPRANPKGSYDLVSLLIGVNNQYPGRSLDQYRKEFPALLKRAIGFAGGKPERVIVLSIPDYGATPFGQGSGDAARIGQEIDQYNAIASAASGEAHVRFVDITPGSRRATEDKSLVAEDGLHPSGTMYAEWVKLALPEARAALGQPAAATTKPAG